MQIYKRLSIPLLLLFVTLIGCSVAQDVVDVRGFDIKTGDILFQANDAGSYTSAIENTTKDSVNIAFSHVGVAYIEDSSVYVLEAIPYGVSKTPIETFLRKSKQANNRPVVIATRLKKRYQKSIPNAIDKILSLVGKRYDFLFDPTNDMYYCSELIDISFLHKGKPIFESAPMSFKDKDTGETNPYWIDHFKIHGQEIPEGVLGTNPSDMFKSKSLTIVHRFYTLDGK